MNRKALRPAQSQRLGNKYMGQTAQFGEYYAQVVDRFFHALEWRYNEIKGKTGQDREIEIVAKLLDLLLADQIGHDIALHDVETALRSFQRVRHDSFTPGKYKEIIQLMGVNEEETLGYVPQLFGSVTLDVRHSA